MLNSVSKEVKWNNHHYCMVFDPTLGTSFVDNPFSKKILRVFEKFSSQNLRYVSFSNSNSIMNANLTTWNAG